MKLFRLREWLTVEEAARHLTNVLDEDVTESDILRLGLDGHLTLSVNFVNYATARCGRVVPFKDVPLQTLPMMRGDGSEGETVHVPDGFLLDEVKGEISPEARFVCFDKNAVTIDGVWDLPMLGSAMLDIEHAYQARAGGPSVELVNIVGTFVFRSDAHWAQLLDRFADSVVETPDGKKRKVRGTHYPAGGLPSDAPLVVRTAALTEFQAKLKSPSPGEAGSTGTRERDTLLKLVIGMAIGGYGYRPGAARSQASTEIAADLAGQGIAITDDTVRKYLKEAAATVLPRAGKA